MHDYSAVENCGGKAIFFFEKFELGSIWIKKKRMKFSLSVLVTTTTTTRNKDDYVL